jgi:hypothetical protein
MKPKKFQKGDLVRWFINYPDIMIVKDSGLGIIASITVVATDSSDIQGRVYNRKYHTFKIYRIDERDYMFFEEHNLEKL